MLYTPLVPEIHPLLWLFTLLAGLHHHQHHLDQRWWSWCSWCFWCSWCSWCSWCYWCCWCCWCFFLMLLMFLILQMFVLKRSVLLNYTVAMVKWFSIHHIYGQKCTGAISGLGWDWVWVWDLCVGLLYEHRFAVLKRVTQANICALL